jgi:hypothetical protein
MRTFAATLLMLCSVIVGPGAQQDVRVLATAKTSTMEKEMNDAAEAGFRFAGVMGGDTAFGGSEVVVIMTRTSNQPHVQYKLLATGKTSTISKTSTMEKELRDSTAAGYEFVGMTVGKALIGGEEIVSILRRNAE